jgi:hypothetical protein
MDMHVRRTLSRAFAYLQGPNMNGLVAHPTSMGDSLIQKIF